MQDPEDYFTPDLFTGRTRTMPMQGNYNAELLEALVQIGGGSIAYAIEEYHRVTQQEKEIDFIG